MSILKAMYAGVSGLTAETGALGVVGDNLANSSTIGFKQSRALFSNVLGAAMGSKDAGSGVIMTRAQQIFGQGGLVNTGQSTDVALSGDGFLVVAGKIDGVQGSFYTRNGQFDVQNDGKLINGDGLAVQGYKADATGAFSTTVGDITLPTAPIPPKATGTLKITANCDAAATIPADAWDPDNASKTSNLATSITMYDSLGNSHSVDVYFRKTAEGTWDYHALAKGSEIAGGGAGMVEIAGGTLDFDANGALKTITPGAGGTVSFAGGAAGNQPVTIDLGKAIDDGGTGLEGVTQYGSTSTVSAQSQDGYASGALSGIKISSDGTVNGVYTNGQTIAAGKLAVAKFQSNDGLGKAGHNLWISTRESGEAALGDVGTGGRAALVAGSLEQSNVDTTQQFVELISHQRAFQANSKTITTADQMLQELMSIKQ